MLTSLTATELAGLTVLVRGRSGRCARADPARAGGLRGDGPDGRDRATRRLRLIEQQRPHVLVSDIGMPEVDGYELLKRVRALGTSRGGRLPAIALTAFARSEDRTRALRAGFLVHVAKPVDPTELVATVASVAGRVHGVA